MDLYKYEATNTFPQWRPFAPKRNIYIAVLAAGTSSRNESFGHATRIVKETSVALSHQVSPINDIRPDRVMEAKYVRPSRLFLRFIDGLEGTWTFGQLDLDMSNMKLSTVRASDAGNWVEVKSKLGENVKLDSSSLRVLIDPKFAAEIEEKLNILATQIGL